MATKAKVKATRWALKGHGYEFCNCDFACGCNFGGFPSSKDGSCRALVGLHIKSGSCSKIDLSGLKCAAILDWPKAIHEGNGRCVFVVEPTTTDKQIEALGQIFTGKLGGMPWELLGPTYAVTGLVKTKITIEGKGTKSVFRAEGVGEGRQHGVAQTALDPVILHHHDAPAGRLRRGMQRRRVDRLHGVGVNHADRDPLALQLVGGLQRLVQRDARANHRHLVAV